MAMSCEDLTDVTVAVDEADTALIDHLRDEGIPYILTPSDCSSGTARIAEAIKDLDGDLFCNFQGDIVSIHPPTVDRFLTYSDIIRDRHEPFVAMPASMILYGSSTSVMTNKNNEIVYGARTMLHKKQTIRGPFGLHGIYVYDRMALEEFSVPMETVLDKIENLEFMRFVELKIPVHIHKWTDFPCVEVNDSEDVAIAEEVLRINNV